MRGALLALQARIRLSWKQPSSVILLSLMATVSFAQSTQLSPEQQQLLDQLPPEQRQQALREIQGAQRSGRSGLQPIIEEQAEQPRRPITGSDDGSEESSLRAGPRSRIILRFRLKEPEAPGDESRIEGDPLLSQLEGSHYFLLDESGGLSVLGLPAVPLLGLTEPAIAERMSAEAVFSPFDIEVTLLDLELTGTEALKPFGFDLFQNNEIGFDPPMAGPVPPDYVLGPGDSIRVQLYGNDNSVFEFDVSRDGVLNLPKIGPVNVSGLSFSEFRRDLEARVDKMLIGTKVSITMGQLRTVRVFVLGDANRPGSYVVSSLATISSALYRSGGLSKIGSMRDIMLKRQGNTVATLDLYDLLINGDTSDDRRLQSGDVIFVPPIGDTVSISGAVRRPAIYELKSRRSVAEIVKLAGGLDVDAYRKALRLERIDSEKGRIVLTVDATTAAGGGTVLRNGDALLIPKVLPEISYAVTLEGHVQRPGSYQWRSGMRLTDLLQSGMDLVAGADANYVMIRRESSVDRSVEVVSADLVAALRDPGSEADVILQGKDKVYVFNLEFGRQRIIAPILEELRTQSEFGSPYSEVSVGGQVRAPGEYPLEAAMRVSDLLRAGGGMREDAYALDAELTRFSVIDGEYRTKEIVRVDLGAVLRGDRSADFELSAHDYLSISLIPDWNVNWSVTIEGEVKFPGEYQILQGETLSHVITRAGGLTDHAFPQGAVFLRESLREREREQLDALAVRMESDLTSLSFETLDTTGQQALQTGGSLLTQLRGAEPVGRLVIDIEQISSQTGGDVSLIQGIELRDGDRLLVPVMAQEVTIIGEVQQPTSHLYQPSLIRDDYIKLSGGLTRRADKKLIYVVRASGAVVASSQSRWLGRGASMDIRPGDTIVVPLEIDRIKPLTLWTNVMQIVYQAAIAVAAVNSFD